VGNTGRFTIRYTGRDAGCAVFLTASAACGTNRAFLAPADASALQEWVLTSTGVSPRCGRRRDTARLQRPPARALALSAHL
jgi:hypothetical protein